MAVISIGSITLPSQNGSQVCWRREKTFWSLDRPANDWLQVGPVVTNPTWLFGSAGNDWAFDGSGPDVLDGETGNDRLFGGFGRDLLIGGIGRDRLFGEFGQDILIGGSLTFDCQDLALSGTWQSEHHLAHSNSASGIWPVTHRNQASQIALMVIISCKPRVHRQPSGTTATVTA